MVKEQYIIHIKTNKSYKFGITFRICGQKRNNIVICMTRDNEALDEYNYMVPIEYI